MNHALAATALYVGIPVAWVLFLAALVWRLVT